MESIIINPQGQTIGELLGISKERGEYLMKEVERVLLESADKVSNDDPNILQIILDKLMTVIDTTNEAEKASTYYAFCRLLDFHLRAEYIKKLKSDLFNMLNPQN